MPPPSRRAYLGYLKYTVFLLYPTPFKFSTQFSQNHAPLPLQNHGPGHTNACTYMYSLSDKYLYKIHYFVDLEYIVMSTVIDTINPKSYNYLMNTPPPPLSFSWIKDGLSSAPSKILWLITLYSPTMKMAWQVHRNWHRDGLHCSQNHRNGMLYKWKEFSSPVSLLPGLW